MRRIILLQWISLFLAFPSLVFAQTPHWEVFDTQNTALPHNTCNGISFDPNENVWVATSNGLASIKNESWQVMMLPEAGQYPNWLSAIAFGRDSTMWIGTVFNGVSAFYENNWESMRPGNIQAIFVDKSNIIWIASHSGLYKFDNRSVSVFDESTSRFPSPKVQAVLRDKQGILWVGTHPHANYPGGLAWYDGRDWHRVNTADGLPDVFINDMTLDRNGNIYLASNAGVIKKSGNNWSQFTPNNSALPSLQVNTIALDSAGNIWAGTNKGIGISTKKGWTVFSENNSGLPDNHVNDIQFASDGSAWVATNHGIGHFTKVLNTPIAPLLSDFGHTFKGPFPNPFGQASKGYGDLSLKSTEDVKISLIELSGRDIQVFHDGNLLMGEHTIELSLDNSISAGIYFIQVQVGDSQEMFKVKIF